MPANPQFSPQALFDIGVAGYLQELRSLVRIIDSDSLTDLLPLFTDYSNFLDCNLNQYFPQGLILELANAENTIYVDRLPKIGERLFNCASVAAACETFNGWTINAGTITEKNCSQLLQENIQISGTPPQRLAEIMGIRLNRSDAVRTAQIIKLLGLLPNDSMHYDQLALGASMARRDREGFHRIPGIGPEKPGADFSSSAKLNFAVKSCEPNSLVIIDNDKNLEQDFAQINRTESPTIQALNLDLYEGLDRLATILEQGDSRPCNLVTMFRFEPEALPDIAEFLDKLSRVVNQSAYLVATIGSGNTQSEFVARQKTMDELTAQLKAQGQSPLRINMYQQENQTSGLASPVFGVSEYASFEILFCQLTAEFSVPGQRQSRLQQDVKTSNLNLALNPDLWNSFLPTNRLEMVQGIITFLKTQNRLSDQTTQVLNLGAGVGETSSYLEKLHPPFSITDIDQVPFRRDLMHQRYVQADITDLPFHDFSYDALFSSFAFSYLGNSTEVMGEWLRVLKPGGHAYFAFHAPHSAYLNTAREMLSANMAKDFFQLLQHFPGRDFTGLYDWFCQQNFAWGKAFKQERQFLSYAQEIQVCKHLVEKLAQLMFSTSEQIYAFFEGLGATEVSVNVVNNNFDVLPCTNAGTEPMLAWFVVLKKTNASAA